MANIRKSFNFRSGLQVDNDNFVINANGLVGIGTSIPKNYFLNVYGDKGLRVTGLTTTQDLNVSRNVEISGITTVGVLTASSIDIANGVNVGGALTAATLKLTNGDTVDNLIGFARTTFITDNSGVGLHTTSKIGINTTTSPVASDSELTIFGNANVTGIITATTFSGDVSGNVNSGISTFTELKVGTAISMFAGIVTATTFSGDVSGNVNSGISTFTELKVGTAISMFAGIVTATTFDGALNSTNLTGTIDNARLPDVITSNINSSSGISTFTELKVGTAITMSAGIVTATTFDGALDSTNLTGTIDNARLPDVITSNINSSGISTFTELKVGTAITMSAGIITATTFEGSLTGNVTGDLNGNVDSGISTFTELKVGTEITMSAGIITATTFSGDVSGNVDSGISTFTELKVGTAITMSAGIITATTFVGSLTGTATTATNLADAANITTGTLSNDRLPVTPQFTSVGIGTDSPTDALHIQQSGAAEIYVGSDTDSSSIRVGRNLDDNTSGMVQYGNTSGAYPLSNENSLDFMNFGWGNVNFYLQAGITTTSDLNFTWNVGSNSPLMTLTDQGNLGIGITNPTHLLNVQGISTFTDNAHFNENVTIDQDLILGGNLTFGSGATISASFRGNLESADGSNIVIQVPTDSSDPVENAEVKARIVGGASTITKLDITGIGYTNPVFSVKASGGSADSVGDDIVINVNNAAENKFVVNNLGGVGIGTTNPVDSLDMIYAQRPAVFPNMSTSFRDTLESTTGIATSPGSIIYNTTVNKHQGYNGTSWNDLY
jgi:uncharacterized Fe-S center protein